MTWRKIIESNVGCVFKASNVARENLISLGTCFGKFTKTRKFRLHITALDFLAPYAQHKVWAKTGAEQQFLYGHHVMKSGLGRITENTPKYQVWRRGRKMYCNCVHIQICCRAASCTA